MDIANEPVRGGYPPPGFRSLPGVEQARALAQGLVPRPPFFRLFGIQVTHAAPGTATVRMPASPWLQSAPGTQQLLPLVRTSLAFAARTVCPPGVGGAHRHLALNYIRTAALDMESFTARSQVVMAGPTRVTTESRVEDLSGRLLIHATGQFALHVDDPPLPPPPRLGRHEDSPFTTPDPPSRPLDAPIASYQAREFGPEFVERLKRGIADGAPPPLPIIRLIGGRFTSVNEGSAECEVPSTEWLCNEHRRTLVAVGIIALGATSIATGTLTPKGKMVTQNAFNASIVGVNAGAHPDGSLLRARAKVVHGDEHIVITDAQVFDADDQLAMFTRSTFTVVSARDGDDPRDKHGARGNVGLRLELLLARSASTQRCVGRVAPLRR